MPPVDPRWIRNPSDELAVSQGCYFDLEAGDFPCDFIEAFCRQSKGEWAGRPLILLDWQRDFLRRLFGWKAPDGRRRFKRAYLEVAKKNGKSTLSSGVLLFMLLADGEGAPECYLNACDRKQARIVFDEAARMVQASPELSSRLEVIDSSHRIVWEKGNGVALANSAEAPNKDGLNPSFVEFDELHRQPDTALWDVFEYAAAARRQPLTLSITTAGEDESGVWFEQRDYSEKVARGEIPDITHLGVVYRADPKDDLDDPATWYKANPSLGHTIDLEDFRRELAAAKETPRKLAGFLRLRLNIVCKSDVVFIAPEEWKRCGSPKPDPARLAHLSCYAGGDLSRTTDLTAVVALWGDESLGYDLRAWFWVPEENILERSRRDRVDYLLWVKQGWITATPGAVVDYAYIRKTLVDLAGENDLRKLLFDPWNATQLVSELRDEDGLPADFIRQGFLSHSAPTKHLERLVKTRKIRHGNNPVLTWMMGNAVSVQDAHENIKLDKQKSRCRIDGAIALVNALAAAMSDPDGGESVYEHRGLQFI
jgi:phage terminase large subunit-like protein